MNQFNDRYDPNLYNYSGNFSGPGYDNGLSSPDHPENQALADDALKKGILSLVFANIGILAFLGIIFGAKGKKRAKEFAARCGVLSGKAKAGNILSKIGFILSIVMTVYCAVAFAIGVIIAMEGGEDIAKEVVDALSQL